MSNPAAPAANSSYPTITYESYANEGQIATIQDLVKDDLSEPYTVFTYRYFCHEFPQLCIFAYLQSETPGHSPKEAVGVVVCRQDVRRNGVLRGYIGMLAVRKPFRHFGIATSLVKQVVERMHTAGCQEIVLETEVDNAPALAFYSRLNFIRYKRMHGFYLNRKDAFRLFLPLPPRPSSVSTEDHPVVPQTRDLAQHHVMYT